MQIDFPNVRTSFVCPLCGRHKEAGLICCWSCYRERHIRNGNKEVEALIAEAEAELMLDKGLSAQGKE